MAKKIKLNKKELSSKVAIMVVLAVVLAISCLFFSSPIENFLGIGKTEASGKNVDIQVIKENDFVVHYIDVGQADCTFIELPDGANMIIDVGDVETKEEVVSYISALGVTQITHMILTHSDSDHIGGAPYFLDSFEVVNIHRPFALSGEYEGSSEAMSAFNCYSFEDLSGIYSTLKIQHSSIASKLPRITTTVYKNTIEKIYQETYTNGDGQVVNSNVSVNFDGDIIGPLDNAYDYEIEFYAPLVADVNINLNGVTSRTSGYVTKGYGTGAEGKNAISPVIRVEYLDNKFLFTGDIYDTAEADVINSLLSEDLEELSNITVYQAGHHGATNSNTEALLNIIKPTYTVVSCGLNNKYKHPTEEFLTRLKNLPHNVTDYLLRTDLQGTIAFAVSDSGEIVYAAGVIIESPIFAVEWWQIAVGIFIVAAVLLFNIKMPKQSKRK